MMLLNEFPYPTTQEWAWADAENRHPLVAADLQDLGYGISECLWDKRGMNGMGAPWTPYSAGMGQAGTILPDPVTIPTVQQLQKWVAAHPKVQKVLAHHPGLRHALKTRALTRGVRGLGQACDPNCLSTTGAVMNDSSGVPCCSTTAVPSSVPSSALAYSFTDATGTFWNCSSTGICAPNYGTSTSATSTSLIPGVSNTMLFLGVAAIAAVAFMSKGSR